MSDEQSVLADRLEIRGYEGTVAIFFEITAEQLAPIDIGRDLVVLAAFVELDEVDDCVQGLQAARSAAALFKAGR